jgi:hypothetical protein
MTALFTLANAVSVAPTGSFNSIVAPAFNSNSGDLLVAAFVTFGTHTLTSPVSDNKSNTWSQAIGLTGVTQGFGWMYYAPNIAGGAGHVVTVALPIADFAALAVYEISGAALSSVLGSTNTSTASGTTHSSGNITSNSVVPEVFVGIGAVSRNAESAPVVSAYGWVPPLLKAAGASNEGFASGVRFVPQSVTDQFTFTDSAAFNEACLIAGFKAASSSGGGISEVSHPFIGF